MGNKTHTRGSEVMAEATEKHRHIKVLLLDLMEKSNIPNFTKEKMRDEMFKIYLEFK